MKPILTLCGYRCDLCLAYRPNVEQHPENRQQLSDGWFKYFHFRTPPDAILCDGCLGKRRLDPECPVRPCALAKGLENCAECDEYVCERLKERLVWREALEDSRHEKIPDDEYRCFILPYENKPRLDEIRAKRNLSGKKS